MGEEWIIDIECKRRNFNPISEKESWRNLSIYKVPKVLRDLHVNAYTPQVASFGPYHHGSQHLMPMERFKRRALFLFLGRAEKTLAEVVEEMRREVGLLRESYDELDAEWSDDDRFLRLMILDGCFMLQIIDATAGSNWQDVSRWDPVFGNKYNTSSRIWLDMLKLENQLPLRVLLLLSMIGGIPMEDTMRNMEVSICLLYPGATPLEKFTLSASDTLHVLDAYRKIMLHEGDYTYNTSCLVPSATKLHESGVQFGESKTNCFSDISFHDGFLYLPQLQVDDTTEHQLMNLLTFEQLHPDYRDGIVSYVAMMDYLIDTEGDVALLRKEKVIVSFLGSDSGIADLFNCLCKEIDFGGRMVTANDVNKKLSNYYHSRWRRLRASFTHTYLRNLWVFFSLLGALLLLFLTIAQTVYTALSYHRS